MEKNVKAIMLTLLVASTLGIALVEIRTVANPSPREWIVDWQTGINFRNVTQAMADPIVSDGDILWVKDGTYHEHINVNKSVTIRAFPDAAPVFDGSGEGKVFWVTKNNVQILNLTIRNGEDGIRLNATATRCNVSSNFVHLNKRYGIYVASSDNTLRNNDMTNNEYNFGISNFVNNDIDPSNTVDGKPVYIWVDHHHDRVPTYAGYVAVVNSTNINATDLSVSKNDYGLRFYNSLNLIIQNVTVSDNAEDGIFLSNVTNCKIANVEAKLNSEGIDLKETSDSTIEDSDISYNAPYGVTLDSSNSTVIRRNIISNNHNPYGLAIGISFMTSGNNIVIGNTIKNNDRSIWVWSNYGHSNTFYHNNIINNTQQKPVCVDSYNLWDNGREGNYWSDYIGEDANRDGIGDTPYPINPNNADWYPLMKPWKEIRTFDVWHKWNKAWLVKYNITICSDHVIACLDFTRIPTEKYPRIISFNITAGSPGFCNITIPRTRLDGPFRLSIDGQEKNFILTQNANYSSIYFTYTIGTYHAEIKGTEPGYMLGDVNGDARIDMIDIVRLILNFTHTLPDDLTPKEVDP